MIDCYFAGNGLIDCYYRGNPLGLLKPEILAKLKNKTYGEMMRIIKEERLKNVPEGNSHNLNKVTIDLIRRRIADNEDSIRWLQKDLNNVIQKKDQISKNEWDIRRQIQEYEDEIQSLKETLG